MVGICLYGFTSHSGLITHQISQLFWPPSSRRLCHGGQNTDASYMCGRLETAVISFSSIVEDQKELMFARNFSCCGKTITSQSAIGCCFGIAATNLYLLQIDSCGHSGRCHGAAHCSQGGRRPSSGVHIENEWQPVAFDTHEAFGVNAQLHKPESSS